MRTLQEIRDARVVLRAELDKLDAADPSPEGLTRTEEIETEFESLEREEAVLEKRAAREAATGAPAGPPVVGGEGEGDGQISEMRDLHAERGFRDLGDQLYQAVHNPSDTRFDKIHEEVRITGSSESVPTDGGFLVQKEIAQEIFELTHETGVLSAATNTIQIAVGNGLIMNATNDTSRVNGSRWGGRAYWVGEGVAPTKSKLKLRRM